MGRVLLVLSVAIAGLLLLGAAPCSEAASILSSSMIDLCSRSSSGLDLESSLNCSKKLVVVLSLENGDQGTTELQAALQGAITNGTSSTFENALNIKLFKTAVSVVYPLNYYRTVNGKPKEIVYQMGWTLNPPACEDGTNKKTTCGWYKDPSGNNIPYSNGFCCRCSISQVFENDDFHRGSLDCNPFKLRMSSAHCLRFSDTWWDLFDVEPSIFTYQIYAEISGAGITVPYNLTMDQSTPFFVNSDNTLSGRIIGDFAATTSTPAFESFYLAVARNPATSAVVEGGVKNWLMVPRDLVDLSGTGCNKIGVSFEAFYNQGQRCSLSAGSCLYNQLDDLWSADDALRAANRTPNFMLQRWGPFKQDVDRTKQFDLTMLPKGIQNTLITLNIKADSIRFITNRSTGKIAAATIKDFVTFSRDGIIYTAAVNTGTIIATYFMTVGNCSTLGVLPVPAQQFSLGSLQTFETQFQLYSQNLFSSSDQCTVSLYDSSYYLLDSVIVRFNTTAYTPDRGNQGGDANLPPASVEFMNPSIISCSQKCPGFWSIPCFVVTGCWTNVLWVVLLILGIIVLLFVLFKTRLCYKPVHALSGYCSGGKKKRKRKTSINDDSNDEVEMEPQRPKRKRRRATRQDPRPEDSEEDKSTAQKKPTSKSRLSHSDFAVVTQSDVEIEIEQKTKLTRPAKKIPRDNSTSDNKALSAQKSVTGEASSPLSRGEPPATPPKPKPKNVHSHVLIAKKSSVPPNNGTHTSQSSENGFDSTDSDSSESIETIKDLEGEECDGDFEDSNRTSFKTAATVSQENRAIAQYQPADPIDDDEMWIRVSGFRSESGVVVPSVPTQSSNASDSSPVALGGHSTHRTEQMSTGGVVSNSAPAPHTPGKPKSPLHLMPANPFDQTRCTRNGVVLAAEEESPKSKAKPANRRLFVTDSNASSSTASSDVFAYRIGAESTHDHHSQRSSRGSLTHGTSISSSRENTTTTHRHHEEDTQSSDSDSGSEGHQLLYYESESHGERRSSSTELRSYEAQPNRARLIAPTDVPSSPSQMRLAAPSHATGSSQDESPPPSLVTPPF